MKQHILGLLLVLSTSLTVKAQAEKNSLSLSVGGLDSFTKVVLSPGNLIGIGTYYGKPGVYAGLTYDLHLPNFITLLTQINYQNKGTRFDDLSNGVFRKRSASINYFGFSSLVRLILIKKISLYAGPELNLLLTRNSQNLLPLESGLLGHVTYRTKRIGFTGSYFHGLSPFIKTTFNTQYEAYYNSTIRASIQYRVNK